MNYVFVSAVNGFIAVFAGPLTGPMHPS